MIEEESIRLAAQDGPSVLEWVAKLREEGHFVSLKRSNESAPAGSQLDNDSFVLIIQTKYQRECWEKYGSTFAGIDGTHNTTHYLNMTLFTLLVRDNWGHGSFPYNVIIGLLTHRQSRDARRLHDFFQWERSND
jgi:hypothetical protein